MYLNESQKALIRKEMVLKYKILQLNKKDYKQWIAKCWKESNPNEPKFTTTETGDSKVWSWSYKNFVTMNIYKNELRKIDRKIRNVQAILKELK